MAEELATVIENNNQHGLITRAIVPCGPKCWYEPFAALVNSRSISLKNLSVFHMDECLDWQGRLLPRNHPYNFRTFMEQFFYGPVRAELSVPEGQRYWLTPATIDSVRDAIAAAPIDITLGGWGQDGHVAYNQARRTPFHHLTLDDLRNSTVRIQENNLDTLIALAHRSFGAAYQFVPPMSVTLGSVNVSPPAKSAYTVIPALGSKQRCESPSSAIPFPSIPSHCFRRIPTP